MAKTGCVEPADWVDAWVCLLLAFYNIFIFKAYVLLIPKWTLEIKTIQFVSSNNKELADKLQKEIGNVWL